MSTNEKRTNSQKKLLLKHRFGFISFEPTVKDNIYDKRFSFYYKTDLVVFLVMNNFFNNTFLLNLYWKGRENNNNYY